METTITNNSIASFLLDRKYHTLRHVLLQLVILLIAIGNFFDAPDQLNLTADRIYSGVGYFALLNMLVYFNAYVLFPCFLAKRKVVAYILSVIGFTLFALVLMMILQALFYDVAAIQKEETSGVAIFLSITSSLLAIFLFLGGITAILLFKQWAISKQRIHNLRKATSESELMFLKSQINPHFLFNMLNNANILIEEDPEMASYILLRLDELLRYQLNDSLQDKVSLKAEIQFLTNYLELEKTRRDNFTYQIKQEGDMSNVDIAPLLFIPFVENAVKYNVTGDKPAYVHLSFRLQEGRLSFSCENPIGIHTTTRKEKGGLGLANIRRRLDLLFAGHYSLKQTQTDLVYTVHLKIKL
ncbi:sensor histidine kinase [Bacteroides sp. 51]|uniref:sensor histidine kinase n=1 Tax=Bacteroides sp. 51 TaxID=2302938 RepID=UPI0013CF7E09|nr:histidine kinase [Bacteroides sp. 51]NDV82384.1 histidine kinase [Bacteroides sp. 51]